MCKTRINLGKEAYLLFGMTACVRGRDGRRKYYPCKFWNPNNEPEPVLFFLNVVIIKGEVVKDFKIIVRTPKGTLNPFFQKNGIKKFSSKEVLTVEVENLQSKTTETFKISRTQHDDGTKVLNVETENEGPIEFIPWLESDFGKRKNNTQERIFDPIESKLRRKQNSRYKEKKQNFAKERNLSRNEKEFRVGTPLGKYPFLGIANPQIIH